MVETPTIAASDRVTVDKKPVGSVRVVDLTLRGTPDILYTGVKAVRIIQTSMIPLGRQIVFETGETATFNPFKTRFVWDNQG